MSAAAPPPPPPPPPPHQFKPSTTSPEKTKKRPRDDDEKTPEVPQIPVIAEALRELARKARAEEKNRLRKRRNAQWNQLRERLSNARTRARLLRMRVEKDENLTEDLTRAEEAEKVAQAEYNKHMINEPR
jgi:hypothetical protein